MIVNHQHDKNIPIPFEEPTATDSFLMILRIREAGNSGGNHQLSERVVSYGRTRTASPW